MRGISAPPAASAVVREEAMVSGIEAIGASVRGGENKIKAGARRRSGLRIIAE
jgi:hypothetical protein